MADSREVSLLTDRTPKASAAELSLMGPASAEQHKVILTHSKENTKMPALHCGHRLDTSTTANRTLAVGQVRSLLKNKVDQVSPGSSLLESGCCWGV